MGDLILRIFGPWSFGRDGVVAGKAPPRQDGLVLYALGKDCQAGMQRHLEKDTVSRQGVFKWLTGPYPF